MKRLIKAKTGMGLQEVKTPTRLEYLKKKKRSNFVLDEFHGYVRKIGFG